MLAHLLKIFATRDGKTLQDRSTEVNKRSIVKLNQTETELVFNSDPIDLADLLFKQVAKTKQIA